MPKYFALIFCVTLISACGGGADSGIGSGSTLSPSSTTTPTTLSTSTPLTPTSATNTSEPTSLTDAARFLTQATFGPTLQEIEAVAQSGLPAWIDAQMQVQQSAHRAKTKS